MKRIGRFEVDPRDARAVRFLVRRAWVPRSRRESAALRCLAPLAQAWPSLLARADPRPGPAPSLDASLAAVRAALDGNARDLAAGLSVLPPEGGGAARRLLFLWKDDEPLPFGIAKVALAAGTGALDREAEALRTLAALPRAIASRVPQVLCRRDAHGLGVLILTMLDGEPLLRRQRASMQPHAWDALVLGALGAWLGALHEATTLDGSSLLHGDLWSRNVLVGDAAGQVAIVDFEASRRGAAWDDVAHFLLESARAELSARGRRAARDRASDASLVGWLVAEGSVAREGCAAFVSSWKAAFAAAPLPRDEPWAAPLLAFAQEIP